MDKKLNKYSIYVLVVLMMIYLISQCNKYSLIATNNSMSQEIGYGDRECRSTEAILSNHTNAFCTAERCNLVETNETNPCYWHYLGTGNEYQLLAGPLFAVLNSISGIPMGLATELNSINRKLFLAVCCILWSVMTLLGSLATLYWHLAVTRLMLGVFSAACSPFAVSLISEYFHKRQRGTAIGFYNWGVYLGYSLSFVLIIAERELDWRWVFVITGLPGVVMGIMLAATVKEPSRGHKFDLNSSISGKLDRLKMALYTMAHPIMILLCVAGAIRNGAGNLWAFNIRIFFDLYHPGTVVEAWMSWIPLIFGSMGAIGGGLVSDKLTRNRGPRGRLICLCISLCISAPFQVGTIMLPMPWAFISHIPAYVFGEMWIGVLAATVVDLVAPEVQTTCLATYFFILEIIGGNLNVLVTPLSNALNLKWALLILFPGFYIFSALLFFIAFIALKNSNLGHHHFGQNILESKTLLEKGINKSDSSSGLSSDGSNPDFTKNVSNIDS